MPRPKRTLTPDRAVEVHRFFVELLDEKSKRPYEHAIVGCDHQDSHFAVTDVGRQAYSALVQLNPPYAN